MGPAGVPARSTLLAVALGVLVFAAAVSAARPGLELLGTPSASLDHATRLHAADGYVVMPPVSLPGLSASPGPRPQWLAVTPREPADDAEQVALGPEPDEPAPAAQPAIGDTDPPAPPAPADDPASTPSRRSTPPEQRLARDRTPAPSPSPTPARPSPAPAPAEPSPAPPKPAPAKPSPTPESGTVAAASIDQKAGQGPPWGRAEATGHPDRDKLGPDNGKDFPVPPGHGGDKPAAAAPAGGDKAGGGKPSAAGAGGKPPANPGRGGR